MGEGILLKLPGLIALQINGHRTQIDMGSNFFFFVPRVYPVKFPPFHWDSSWGRLVLMASAIFIFS